MTRATPPFFVVGNPRSGTKMFRELLNNSPDIWISNIETYFIPRFTRSIDRFGDLADRANFARLAAALGQTRAFAEWRERGIVIDPDTWYDTCRAHDWPGVIEGLFRCVHAQEIPDPPRPWAEIVWGDKTPAYMTEVPLLATLFPAARFVHLIRDPRDCGLSAERAWGTSPLRTAQQWADRTRACRAAGRPLGSARYLEVSYEGLVADVTGTLARVFTFLGVPTPLDAGRFLRVPENLGSARGVDHVVTGNAQKWRTQMAPEVRRRIEQVSGDLLDDLGYDREHPDLPTTHLSPVQMATHRLYDAWHQLRFERRHRGGWVRALRYLLVQ